MLDIGLISQEYPPETAKGGIGTQTLLKARGLAALGHRVRVISRTDGPARSEHEDGGVTVVRLPSAGLPAATAIADWLLHSARVAEEIARQHALRPFDILDFPEWGGEGFVHLANQADWNRIPTVVQLHGPLVVLARTIGWPAPGSELFRIGGEIEAATLRLADAVYSSSVHSARWCAREHGLEADGVPILHSGVDLDLFRPDAAPSYEAPVVVFAGKIVANKGVETLVRAALRLAPEFPALRLDLLGRSERPMQRTLSALADAAGAPELLSFAGFVDREDLPARLARARVFAAPSVAEGGPGFVYLEAMGCGLPVIGCSGSGAAEVIRDGDNGLLVAPGDIDGLASALRGLLSDDALHRRMAARALDFARSQADTRTCVPRIASFYRSVLEDRCRIARVS